jgi:hypothetical protein
MRASRASSTSCAVDTLSPKNRLAVSGSWCASSKITVLQAGSSSATPLVAQHHVGEEQMVVDHHHVGRLRLAPRRHDEALLGIRAVLAEAVVARRGRRAPGAGILRHRGALGLVAGVAALGEAGDGEDVAGLLAREEAAGLLRPRQVVVADVVGAALEQRDAGRRASASRTVGRSRRNSWSCRVLVPVETITLPPASSAGTR